MYYTSHVLCKHRNGERANLANFGMLLVDRLSFFWSIKSLVGCIKLGDFLVHSLVLVDRLLYLVTATIVTMMGNW